MTMDVTWTGADDRLAEAAVVDAAHVDVSYKVRGTDRLALRDVSFQIGPRESFGLVGESGSGKTTMALAITRYLARNGRVSAGSITVNGQDVGSLGRSGLRQLRARTVSMVYQEPGRALNPSIKVGRQVAEVFEIAGLSRSDAAGRAEEALRKVQISDPGRVLRSYPHQLSGGMLQRVVIAMALAAEPNLLILDEPTTALDATVEAMCERVGVMYAGELVEQGPAREVFEQPRHPYTVGLLRCIPRRGQRKDHGRLDTIPGFLPAPGEVPAGCIFAQRCALADERCRTESPPPYPVSANRTSRCHHHEQAPSLPRATPEDIRLPPPDVAAAPVISLRGVAKTYTVHRDRVQALVGVDLDLHLGETLGLVGESGSGKTTLARVLVGLTSADEGSTLELEGRKLAPLAARRSRDQLRAMQIVFQNPDSALNRRHSVRHLIDRSLTKLAGLSGAAREKSLQDIVRSVRMEPRHLGLRPAQLSGGLKQRVAIARAFAGNPHILVCDEPTSALDVSVQAAILNLLAELQGRQRVTYLFISHDLGVVRYLADRIAVLYLGRVMEYADAETVFTGPHHPYAALGMRLPYPLPAPPVQRDLRVDGAPARRGGAGPHDALPHTRSRIAHAAAHRHLAERKPGQPRPPTLKRRNDTQWISTAPLVELVRTVRFPI